MKVESRLITVYDKEKEPHSTRAWDVGVPGLVVSCSIGDPGFVVTHTWSGRSVTKGVYGNFYDAAKAADRLSALPWNCTWDEIFANPDPYKLAIGAL